MSYIFRFHKGTKTGILDWQASNRITPNDVKEVMDKTNTLSSAAGTSIPTPIARMYLFKTAFEIVASQLQDNKVERKSIYAGLVSEVLDLLELLYKCGGDSNKLKYKRWVFNSVQNSKEADNFFGSGAGHKLLAESFKQAASQEPFNNKIEITLIYYKENGKEILIGGTSPFTLVFTSPNFKRKMKDKEFKRIAGLVTDDYLFDNDYKQLQERDGAFIKYIENLKSEMGNKKSFEGFIDYVSKTKNRYENAFDKTRPNLEEIRYEGGNFLEADGIELKQLKESDYQQQIASESDFKIELPEGSHYDAKGSLPPLFLIDRMTHQGQYISSARHWSERTRVIANNYPETTVEEIKERELPGVDGFKYPFLIEQDFFEIKLIQYDGYTQNNEYFISLSDNQHFLLPIKPIFFHFFPIKYITKYIEIKKTDEDVEVTIKIPIYGPTKSKRQLHISKKFIVDDILVYSGILGIFPITKTNDKDLSFINKYTIASYEKINAANTLEEVKFYKEGEYEDNILNQPQKQKRAEYDVFKMRTAYYQVENSFDIIQLNFKYGAASCGGLILPIFKEVKKGTEEYIYAIDFGTTNTHIEYSNVKNSREVVKTLPFTITEKEMQMVMLHKPKERVEDDGASRYKDYENGFGVELKQARIMALREFVPFEIGPQKSASVNFPFITATCENQSFINDPKKNSRLFIDANIGFHLIQDSFDLSNTESIQRPTYTTNLKWALEENVTKEDSQQRVRIFFRQLLLMIRTKAILENSDTKRADISKLKVVLSFPLSMGKDLKKKLVEIFTEEKKEIIDKNFSAKSNESENPIIEVTESIAPYYELKHNDGNSNIESESFCNIDIGGGTTDLAVINPSKDNMELECHCCSFKFAGQQLWGSGNNPYRRNENGFVAYYKDFINKNDNHLSRALEGLLDDSFTIRTEDIVGILFTSPPTNSGLKSYRFTEIFADKPELRVVLFVHYAAIIYYLCKFLLLKEKQIPRNLSFSGKGSQYINLVFANEKDLLYITRKLIILFSGLTPRNDFAIRMEKNPKAVTAKGSVCFAAEKIKVEEGYEGLPTTPGNEKKIVIYDGIYKGFADATLESNAITYSSLRDEKYFTEVINSQTDFLNKLFTTEISNDLYKLTSVRNFLQYKSFFIPSNVSLLEEGVLRDSFLMTLNHKNGVNPVSDSPFFFALSYALIKLSKQIANESVNK